ncbi:hypothetical protein CHUAL_001652 [Chamberlinius hualienensis]
MKHRHRIAKLDSTKFVNEIKKFPALYDPSDVEYRNMDFKNSAWKAIAAVVELPVRDCQLRWKSLRDRFVREKRSYKQDPSSKVTWSLYYQLTFLTHCISHKTRKSESNSEADITEEDDSTTITATGLISTVKTDENSAEVQVVYSSSSDSDVPADLGITVGDISIGPVSTLSNSKVLTSPQSTGRKRTHGESKVMRLLTELVNKPDPDEDELFFLSAAKMIKRVPLEKKSALKMKIMELIANHEMS